MIEIWGLDGAMSAEAAETRAVEAGKALLNGPARPGDGLDQADVDMVMGPAAGSRAEEVSPPLQPEEENVAHAPAGADVAASRDQADHGSQPVPQSPV